MTDSPPELVKRMPANKRYWLLFVCLFAALTHGGFYFYRPPVALSPDEREYSALGINLAETGQLLLPGGEVAKRMPLYPALIAAIYRWQGPELWAGGLLLLQTFLAWGSTVLLALTAERLADGRAGWMTGTIAAVYAPHLEMQMCILSETLVIFLSVLALFIYVSSGLTAKSGTRYRTLFGVSVLLGLAALTRPDASLLVVPFAVDAACRAGPAAQRGIRTALLVVPVLACLAGWAERNHRLLGSFAVSTTGGLNFHLGHNPEYAGNPGLGQGTDYGAFDRLRGQGVSELEADRRLFREGLSFAAAHPGETLANAGRKVVVWLKPSIPGAARRGPLTPVLALFALAVCGWRQWQDRRLIGPPRTAYVMVLLVLPLSIVCLAFAAWDTVHSLPVSLSQAPLPLAILLLTPLATGLYEVPLGLAALLLLRTTPTIRGLFIGLFVSQLAVAVVFIPLARLRWTVDGLLLIALGVAVSRLCIWLSLAPTVAADARE